MSNIVDPNYNSPQSDGSIYYWTAEEIAERQAEEAIPRIVPPLETITEAIKALPVAKRTDAGWGAFIGQCLLAIQNNDMEALGYLVNNYQTEDTDYLNLLGQAKQLFGLA